jgi:hypothetical protein
VLTTDRLVITASGSIHAGVILTGENGPRGWDWIDPSPKFPLPGSHPYGLLAKINTDYQYVGSGEQFKRPFANGRLYLRVNDDKPGNGSGAFTVKIQVWR